MDNLNELETKVLEETKDSMDGVLMVATALRHSKTEKEYNVELKKELDNYKNKNSKR